MDMQLNLPHNKRKIIISDSSITQYTILFLLNTSSGTDMDQRIKAVVVQA